MELVTTQDGSQVQLFSGEFPRVRKPVTIASGAGSLVKGTVLGKITKGAVSSAAKSGGNAANTGALTLDATTPKLAGAKAGIYTVRCITAATNGGTFRVTDPNGNVLGDVAVGATFSNQIKFSIADGTQDFIVGEGFDITIAAGSGNYTAYDNDNVDGSETAAAVLSEDVDATSADVNAVAFVAGEFNSAALTGYDAAAGVDFEGTAIFIGSVL
jgi:hypothetical protein